jgi:hypothetical protein
VAALNRPGLYGDSGLLWLQVTKAADGGVTKQWVARYMIAGRDRKMGLGSLATLRRGVRYDLRPGRPAVGKVPSPSASPAGLLSTKANQRTIPFWFRCSRANWP